MPTNPRALVSAPAAGTPAMSASMVPSRNSEPRMIAIVFSAVPGAAGAPLRGRPTSLIASRPPYCTRVAVTFTSSSRLGLLARRSSAGRPDWAGVVESGSPSSDVTSRRFNDMQVSLVGVPSSAGTRYVIARSCRLYFMAVSFRASGASRGILGVPVEDPQPGQQGFLVSAPSALRSE